MSLTPISLSVAAVFICAACTWPTTLVKTDQPHLPDDVGRGWLVVPANVMSDHVIYNKRACSLIVTPGFNKYSIYFEMLDKEAPAVPAKFSMVELRTGTYDISEIYCGHASGNLQFMGLARFNVFPGKISVLAGLHIRIDDHLVMNTFRYSTITEQTAEISHLLTQFKPEEQSRVVSAYTEQPLADKLETKISIPQEMRKSPIFMKNFGHCYENEAKANPLLIGALKFEWTNAGSGSLQISPQASLFTREMKQCLLSTVADFLKSSQADAGVAWL